MHDHNRVNTGLGDQKYTMHQHDHTARITKQSKSHEAQQQRSLKNARHYKTKRAHQIKNKSLRHLLQSASFQGVGKEEAGSPRIKHNHKASSSVWGNNTSLFVSDLYQDNGPLRNKATLTASDIRIR